MNTAFRENTRIEYAGFWKRLAAYLVDSTILGAICWITRLFSIFGDILIIIIPVIYIIGFWSLTGQTPGKAALGIKIIRLDGTDIVLGNAVLRLIGYIISFIIFYIGFLMIGWHRKKRGLHDIIAGTVVINVPSVISEMHPIDELESTLNKADEIQSEYHGV